MKRKKSKNPVTSKTKKRKDAVTFEEILDYGEKLYKEEFKTMDNNIEFYMKMKEKFGEDKFSLIDKAWHKIVSEITIIERFDFNVDNFIESVNDCKNVDEKKEMLIKEKNRIQLLLDELRGFRYDLRNSDRFLDYLKDDEDVEEYLIKKIQIDTIREIILYCQTQLFDPVDLDWFVNMVDEQFMKYLGRVINLLDVVVSLPELGETIKDVVRIEPEKMLWRGTKQDLVALYDKLIELNLIIPDKNKDQLLGKHFQILDENSKQPVELGELKHSRRQLKDGWAKPTEKTEELLKKIQDRKVDNK